MTLTQLLRDRGLDVDEAELAAGVSAALGRLLTPPGATVVPRAEAEVLDAAGLTEATGAYAHSAAEAAGTYAALVATALTVGEAASRLGISEGRVRHRIAARELYALPSGRRRLPAWQFSEAGVLAGLPVVLRALDPAEHPLAVLAFLTTPQPELELDGRPATPEQWLRAGGDPSPVAELAGARAQVAKLPWPPTVAHLRDVGAGTDDRVAITTETVLWRVHRTAGPHPTSWAGLRHYGPVPSCRYDPHPPPTAAAQTEGALYLAISPQTAIAEAFQLRRLVDRHSGAPHLVGLRLTRPLQLLDLARTWPTRAGASQAINSGARDRSRAWARAIRAAFPSLDGLWYPSSMDGGGFCLVLWTPAADALPQSPVLSRALNDPALADRIAGAARRLGYGVL